MKKLKKVNIKTTLEFFIDKIKPVCEKNGWEIRVNHSRKNKNNKYSFCFIKQDKNIWYFRGLILTSKEIQYCLINDKKYEKIMNDIKNILKS